MREVVVVGDGPAGSALAAALTRRNVDTVLVGRDEPWTATYGTWADDIEAIDWLPTTGVWRHRLPSIRTVFGDAQHEHVIERPYGVIDNTALREILRAEVEHVRSDVADISTGDGSSVTFADGTSIGASLVVDATGWPGWSRRGDMDRTMRAAVPRQTAFGVVLDEPPSGRLGEPMLMDYSSAGVDDGIASPTFAYALPVADGWLVEETVLAAVPAVEADRLLPRLAARLSMSVDELLAAAKRTEHVEIPMGGPLPDRTSAIIGFGAAAGMIHPTTGYSVSGSLITADPVAMAIGDHLAAGAGDPRELWATLWPKSARRTRALHDYGLDVLLRLDDEAIGDFFATFFALPEEAWSSYLRITTSPGQLSRVMARMFAAAPWSLRRALVSANPRGFARLLRP